MSLEVQELQKNHKTAEFEVVTTRLSSMSELDNLNSLVVTSG